MIVVSINTCIRMIEHTLLTSMVTDDAWSSALTMTLVWVFVLVIVPSNDEDISVSWIALSWFCCTVIVSTSNFVSLLKSCSTCSMSHCIMKQWLFDAKYYFQHNRESCTIKFVCICRTCNTVEVEIEKRKKKNSCNFHVGLKLPNFHSSAYITYLQHCSDISVFEWCKVDAWMGA